jgi:RNA polymerase-binding transcription factor DksA
LDAPNARAVVVTGSFCGWAPEGFALKRNRQGIWQGILLLPPGRYEYRFLVDGEWQDDPACPERVPNPFGSENCVLCVYGKPPTRGPHMTKKTLDGYLKELNALAGRLNISLAHDQRELMREDEPDVPGGPMPSTGPEANAGEVEIEVGMIANEERLAAEVAAALRRIEAGTFGQCQTCGKAIGRKRLDAVPYARKCIACARASEVAVPS